MRSRKDATRVEMATRSNINLRVCQKRRSLSGVVVSFNSLELVISSIYAQIAKQETRLTAWHAVCVLALGTAGKRCQTTHRARLP